MGKGKTVHPQWCCSFWLAGWSQTECRALRHHCMLLDFKVAIVRWSRFQMKRALASMPACVHHACTYSWTYRWTNAASNAMNSLGYNGWNILCYIHVAIPVSKKLLCTSESIDNAEVDTFPAVMIQTYKLKFMNGFFFPFRLEKKKEKEGQNVLKAWFPFRADLLKNPPVYCKILFS